MDAIHVDIKGDRRVGIVFDEFPDQLYADLRAAIETLTAELLGLVEEATPNRTGRLRSQEHMRVFADKNHIKGQVFIAGEKGSQDFGKAAALEYGARKATNVRGHAMRLDHAWGQMLVEPETVMVGAYTRTPNIDEYRFERGPLAGMAAEINARLEAVVEKAVARTNAG